MKTNSKTELEKFETLKKIIKSRGIKLRILQNPRRVDSLPNGEYVPGSTTIYCGNLHHSISEVTSLLIHELGHHVLTLKGGLWDHTEAQAWRSGAQQVRSELLPHNFLKFQKHCLLEYRKFEKTQNYVKTSSRYLRSK